MMFGVSMYLIVDDQLARIVLYDHIFGAHLLGIETGEVPPVNHLTQWNLFDVVKSIILKFLADDL